MALANSQMLSGVTSIAPTGGTAFTLSSSPVQIVGGKHLINAAVADARVRPNATFKSKVARMGNDGAWSKGKREAVYCVPKLLADGTTKFPLVRVTVEDHPEMTQAEIDHLWEVGAQICFDAEYLPWRRTGSLD